MLITDAVLIWRDPQGDYHVEWDQSHPDTEVVVEPVGVGCTALDRDPAAHRVRMSGLPEGGRHLFRLRDQHGNQVLVPERRLGLRGTPNFRDFGGYTAGDGRRVKWGYLYRSGQLARLSDSDVDLLAGLELELVCDFRQESEQRSYPSRLPREPAPRILSLPIVPGSNQSFLSEAQLQRDAHGAIGRLEMFEFMLQVNREFAEGHRATFAQFFRELLALEQGRFLIHCAAGKDRTGFAAALVLLALGVPRSTVMQDYLLSARYFDPGSELGKVRRKYGLEQLPAEALLPMLEVHEDYLASALDSIEQGYGSVTVYLEEGLGLGGAGLAELRARYLERAV